MRRSQKLLGLAKVLAVILLLAPLSASPLGLGDLRLHSALNQQFEAEIDLVSLGNTRPEDIRVNLASEAAFERAGIDRPLFLNDLEFEVVPGAGDRANIVISSERSVREPFLDFLVEVNWPGGRLLREYTVLLDPPLFVDEGSSVIEAPTVAGAEPAPQAEAPAPAEPSATTVPERLDAATRITGEGSWDYGPVQRSDTLWSIAEQYRGFDDSVTVEQIMMALLRDNPEAFYNNNINELRAGHVLRIDDPGSVGEMAHSEAAAEARRQFSQWQDARREQAQAADPRPLGSEEREAPPSTGVAAATDDGPRLRLTAPDAAEVEQFSMSAAELEAAGSDAAVVARLREDLTAALEVSESARLENIELRQRLAELEAQITSMQRLLSLQEDSMAALQAEAGAALETSPAAVDPAQPDTAAVAPGEAAERAGLVDNVLEDPVMLGAAGAALLMLVTLGWLIVRRRQMAGATLEELTGDTTPRAMAPQAAMATGAAAATTATATGAATDEPETAVAEMPDGLGNAVPATSADSDDELDLMQADEDEIDILAEADVYLAYRRFDKAEELLRDAIAVEPGRQDLVMKLLEVHAGSGNADAFVESARAMQGTDEATWAKVVAMGKQVAPGHSLFSDETTGSAREATGTPEESAELSSEGMTQEGAPELPDTAGLDDLELDFSTEPDQPEEGLGRLGNDSVRDDEAMLDDSDGFRLDSAADESGIESGVESGAGESAEVPAAEPETEEAEMESFGFEIPEDDEATGDGEVRKEVAEASEQPQELDDQVGDEEVERQLLAAAGETSGDIDWLSELGNDLGFEDTDGDENDGEFSGLISGEDEVGTKLDLARAYIDMGDQESARSILDEVTAEGNADQQREASDLIRQIG